MKEIWLDDEQLECEARKRNLKIPLTFCEEMLECTIGFTDKEKQRSC